MKDDRYRVLAEVTSISSTLENSFVLELLKIDLLPPENRSIKAGALRFDAGFVVALFLFSIELVGIAFRKRHDDIPRQMFGTSLDENTTNIPLRKFIETTNGPIDLLVLDSPLRRPTNKINQQPNTKLHWGRAVKTDFTALVEYLRARNKLRSAVFELSKYHRNSIRSISMSLVRLLRGISISEMFKRNPPSRIVFSLSGNACTSVIEQRIRPQSRTVHWLHGVGLGFNFESFSDLTLVNNEYDHQFYNNGLSRESIFFPDQSRTFSELVPLRDIQTIVVYSNLIHPNNENFRDTGFEIERELLSSVATMLVGKNLILRPHPSAKLSLNNDWDKYVEFVGKFGFRVADSSEIISPNLTLFISTVSTCYIDLLAQEKCVLMYDKYGSDHSGFQNLVSKSLKFTDATSLRRTLDLLSTPDRLAAELNSFAVQSTAKTFEFLRAG